MSTITCLKELEEKRILELYDIVEFTIKEETIKYTVCDNHLWDKYQDKNGYCNNNRIFKILKIDKNKTIKKAYGYNPIKYSNHDKYFPEYKGNDFPAITKLVKKLYKIIKEQYPAKKYTKFTRFGNYGNMSNNNYYKIYDEVEIHIRSLYNHKINILKDSIDKKQEETTQYKILYDDILVNFKKIIKENKELEERIQKLNHFNRFEIMEI